MDQLEIARVQLRKILQQRADFLERLLLDSGGELSPALAGSLARSIDECMWIAGHDYEMATEQLDPETGAVLASKSGEHPRLLVHFLGRTPVPPYGGYAADVYVEQGEGWSRLTGLADWRPSQFSALDSLWESPPDAS